MKKLLFIQTLFLLVFISNSFSQPQLNPYIEKYDTCPSWVNELAWKNVLNIKTLANNPAKWDSITSVAIKMLNSQGGGVLYFPAGTYNFNNNIKLLGGVILRGDKPIVTDAKDDSFAPPSRLIFPAYIPTFTGSGTPNSTAFRKIYADSTRNNIGLVYLDINRGKISLGVDGRNVLVFGVRNNNVAEPYPGLPDNYARMEKWQRFSYVFTSNIGVYVNENASIVNNRVNDFMNNKLNPIPDDSYDQPGYVAYGKFKYNASDLTKSFPNGVTKYSGTFDTSTDTTHISNGSWARFNYTDHCAINLNAKFFEPYTTPVEPDQKLEIIDNWIYTTMRVGYFAKGNGMVVRGNIKKDMQNKRVFLHALGIELARNNAATYENRALNFSGHNVLIENNNLEVNRHNILWTGFASVDGEGILTQESVDPYKKLDGIYIRNNTVNAYIGLFWMNDIKDVRITNNNLLNNGYIYVVAKTNEDHRLDNCRIENNYNITGISALGGAGTTDLIIQNNSGSGQIDHSCPAYLSNNTGFTEKATCVTGVVPKPATLKPYAGERDVKMDAVVSVVWDSPVKITNLTGITLIGDSTGLLSGTTASLSSDGMTLTISHPDFPKANDWYTVTIPANALSNNTGTGGNAAISWWRFNIQAKPYIRNLTPTKNAITIERNTEVSVEFSQIVQLVKTDGIKIINSLNAEFQTGDYLWNPEKNTLKISHADLNYFETYTVIIPSGAFVNASNLINDSIIWKFTTSNAITGTKQINDKDEISLFPNPANEQVTILTPESFGSKVQLSVLSPNGMVVLQKNLSSNSEKIDLTHLNPGVYIIQVKSERKISTKILYKK